MSASLNQPSIKPLTLQDVIKKHPQYFFEAMLEFLGDARNPDMHRYRDILQSLVDGVVKRMKKNMSEQEKTMKAIKKIGSVIAIYKKKYQGSAAETHDKKQSEAFFSAVASFGRYPPAKGCWSVMGKIARELGGIEAYVPTRVEQMMREKQGAYDTGAEEDFRDGEMRGDDIMEYDTTSEEVGDEDMEYVQTFFAQDEPYTSSSLRGPTPQHTGMSVVPANLLEDKEVDPDYDATLRHMYNENPQRDVERLIRKKIDGPYPH